MASLDIAPAAAPYHDYAVGYFESGSLESIQGVIDAAEATRSPIIIGFNGEWLTEREGASAQQLRVVCRPGAGDAP